MTKRDGYCSNGFKAPNIIYDDTSNVDQICLHVVQVSQNHQLDLIVHYYCMYTLDCMIILFYILYLDVFSSCTLIPTILTIKIVCVVLPSLSRFLFKSLQRVRAWPYISWPRRVFWRWTGAAAPLPAERWCEKKGECTRSTLSHDGSMGLVYIYLYSPSKSTKW